MVSSCRWTSCLLFVGTTLLVGSASVSRAATVAYYRFEDGFPNVVDEVSSDVHGVLEGVTQTGGLPVANSDDTPNNFAASLNSEEAPVSSRFSRRPAPSSNVGSVTLFA